MDLQLLDKVIKAYDIRGLVDEEITADFTFALGIAFAKFIELEREPATVIIGEDMRPSSPELSSAFADGVTSQGIDVIRIGLAESATWPIWVNSSPVAPKVRVWSTTIRGVLSRAGAKSPGTGSPPPGRT